MKKSFLVVGNWKMNTGLADAHTIASAMHREVESYERVETVLCPPFPWITEIAHEIIPKRAASTLKLGVQNLHYEDEGAFTGEVSAPMVKSLVSYAIVGHSERVKHFGEDAELIRKKIDACLRNGLTPIVCVGELEQGAGSVGQVVNLLAAIVKGMAPGQLEKIVVAYEPVWAIGTGNTATPEYIKTVVDALRGVVQPATRVLYGGSANETNARAIIEGGGIDGFLVGGASLKVKSFAKICQITDHYANA